MAYTQVSALTSFTSGTTIVSADVNSNFTAIRSVVNALVTGTDTIQAARLNPVSGAGVGVNAAALDYMLVRVGGSFTSGGASNFGSVLDTAGDLTGAAGDTSLIQCRIGGTITTQGQSETVTVVTSLYVNEPNITVGSGDTVTAAASLYINSAPTEGSSNYALWVDAGVSRFDGNLVPGANDGAALGTTSLSFSDLFLASGGVVNFDNGDVTLTHSANTLTVAGGTLVSTSNITPASNDGAALGTTALSFSDVFLAAGGTINWNNGAAVLTESSGVVTLSGSSPALAAATLTATNSVGTAALSATSNVTFSGLPTSDPAVAGRLWIDTGAGRVIKVSAG